MSNEAREVRFLKLALCGPSDVAKEISIAQDVITEWNRQHSEARGVFLKHQHWSTDASPDLADRPQGVINRQIIDNSDIIVAVFWSRFGSSTGTMASGTEEEIRRGVTLRKRVMVYFSDLEPLLPHADQAQLDQLWKFRRDLDAQGLCWRFSSRNLFRDLFARHLSLTVNEIMKPARRRSGNPPQQSIVGNNNVQVGGDYNVYTKPPVVKPVIERRPESVTPQEERQIKEMIEALAEGTIGMDRKQAYGMWWSRFKNHFGINRYESLRSDQMEDARQWYQTQKAIQSRGLKTKAPDEYRKSRYGAIKAAMRNMGVSKETYYPELAERLRMKKPFTSLTTLTKRNLERVYNMVMRDSQGA